MNTQPKTWGWVLAGVYLIVAVTAITMNAVHPESELWGIMSFTSTLPWSMIAAVFAWSLAHTGIMGATLLLGAVLNAAIILFLTTSIFRATNRV